MRKLLSVLILVSMLLTSLSFTAGAGYHPYSPADIDGSGAINGIDALEYKKYLAGIAGHYDMAAAELTQDGTVNAKDLLVLKKHMVEGLDLKDAAGIGDGTVGKITIAGRSIAAYTIVVTNPENENMVFAAEELQKYVERATKVHLEIANEESDAEYTITLLEDETDTLGTDGFSITVVDGQLRIMGGALRGTMYGVYELIEEYIGYRFYGYYDSDLWEATAVDIVEGLTDVQIPDARYRDNKISPYRDIDIYHTVIKRKLNGASIDNPAYGYGVNRVGAHAHSFDYYAKDECFVDTQTGKWKHCLTDFKIYTDADDGKEDGVVSKKSTYQAVIENMCNLLDEKIAAGWKIGKEITEVSCSFASDLVFCDCFQRGQKGLCKDITQAEGTYAGTLIDFVNKVEEEISALYPGIRVITNAYGQTKVPPKTRSFNDNVTLLFCWNGCVNHSIADAECSRNGVAIAGDPKYPYTAILGSNVIEKEYYLGWMEHCSQSYIWYYPTNIYFSLAPLSNTFKIYDDMRWFMENGAVGFYVVGTANDAFDGLGAYLVSEMMWDKDITRDEYDQMIYEYLEFYYGPGYEHIYEYIKMLEAAGDEMGCYMTECNWPMEMYSKEYFAKHFDEMAALFDAAYEATEDAGQKENIERASAHLYFLWLESVYESMYVNGTADQRAEYAEVYEGWYEFVNEYDIRITYKKTGIADAFDVNKAPIDLVYSNPFA